MRTWFLLACWISLCLGIGSGFCQHQVEFNGQWMLLQAQSTEIDLFGALTIETQTSDTQVTILQTWGSGRSFSDTLRLKTDGSVNLVPVRERIFPTNVFMGLSLKPGSVRKIRAHWENQGQILKLETELPIQGSQGVTTIKTIDTYQLSSEHQILTYQIQRSTRKSAPAIQYILKRAGAKMAYMMNLEDNWEIKGKLPEQALLISLQGLANQGAPRLYFVYPEKWDFRFTPHVLEFLKDKRYYTFTQLNSADQALNTFKEYVQGYVVWDQAVRTSLMVAFTVAGLEKAVVVTADLIPIVEKYGLKPVADFRSKFTGQSDVEIYSWAYQQYWSRCSKEYIVWLGGESGAIMKPGVADWGMLKQAFFNDLSTRETDTAEYALAQKLLSEMQPFGFVFGWHSYQKDKEREHVKLTSSFALRVEGLHTLPNLSFSSQVPLSPGFVFKNNHHLVPDKKYRPAKKVYVSCIQTDCLGLGAWTRPGRGQIPYAWEVTMNWVWLAPAMMEFFYTQATPNDYFIGALSGPGYMYPKAIPPPYLSPMIEKARALMQRLDLNVFEIMDYSEGATVEGNSELPREIVDAYYSGMPEAIGFVNGYAPAYTFTVKDQRPFISYDYYLSPTRPEADAVADLQELATINTKRPYFLLVHVRQWSDITRVKAILDRLGSEFEVVPLDIFLKLAGQQPTFEERFLER